MAIAEMSKLRLVGLTAEQNRILDALAKTACAEIKECPMPDNTVFVKDTDGLNRVEARIERLENCISMLSHAVEGYARDNKLKPPAALKDGFDLPYGQFMSALDREEEVLALCGRIEELISRESSLQAEATRLAARIKMLAPYLGVRETFGSFKDTRLAVVCFGTVPADKADELNRYIEKAEYSDCKIWPAADGLIPVAVACHRQVAEEVLAGLSVLSFQRCPFTEDAAAADMHGECKRELDATNKNIADVRAELFELKDKIKDIKTLADRYYFEKEKLIQAERFPSTATAFVLEAYVPKEAQNKVSCEINGVSDNVYYEFAEIDAEEMPPTLMKNGKVVKSFEFVTNMYTPPNYREFDPNLVMSFFFAVFLGFIMGDIGYGLVMALGGFGYAAIIRKDTGIRRLALVIAISGIFAIIFGFLFSSFFGFSSVPTDMNKYTIDLLPPPVIDTGVNWRLMGSISVPSVLVISLLMGVVQLMASNACKAYQEFRYGRVADGIFFGLIWVIFLAGLMMFVLSIITELEMGYLALPGAITAGASLLVAMLTAGMHVKGLGKFTKGFGALYGIINYLSDILSYSRLYGLMLSGAIIAQIASGQGWALVVDSGSPVLAVVGVIVIIIGHLFNLAMGLLGGYIHDARLQYIEFFSRFYGGEGELFAPLGSKRKYVSLT